MEDFYGGMLMLEFIIWSILASLMFTAILYYLGKCPLKESVKDGLIKGGGLAILLTIFVKLTDLLYDLIV